MYSELRSQCIQKLLTKGADACKRLKKNEAVVKSLFKQYPPSLQEDHIASVKAGLWSPGSRLMTRSLIEMSAPGLARCLREMMRAVIDWMYGNMARRPGSFKAAKRHLILQLH